VGGWAKNEEKKAKQTVVISFVLAFLSITQGPKTTK
jgi:hypothetical protein